MQPAATTWKKVMNTTVADRLEDQILSTLKPLQIAWSSLRGHPSLWNKNKSAQDNHVYPLDVLV
jgi:hypothetical protein